MNKRILLIILFFAQRISAQVPNYSFENWTNSNPDSWQTTNIPIVPLSIIPDSDSFNGFLAVKGIVVSNNNKPFPPYLGIPGAGALGFHISQEYDIARGWCKLFLHPGDKFSANVRIYSSQQETIGEGFIEIDSTISVWTPFNMHINYFGSTAVENCSMFFTITDSAGLMSGKIGSYFLLDDLSLSSTIGINESTNDREITIYPNPAHSELHIKIPENGNNIYYSLNDIAGKVVIIKKLYYANEAISLTNLSPGIYFLNLYSEENRFVKKVIIE